MIVSLLSTLRFLQKALPLLTVIGQETTTSSVDVGTCPLDQVQGQNQSPAAHPPGTQLVLEHEGASYTETWSVKTPRPKVAAVRFPFLHNNSSTDTLAGPPCG